MIKKLNIDQSQEKYWQNWYSIKGIFPFDNSTEQIQKWTESCCIFKLLQMPCFNRSKSF